MMARRVIFRHAMTSRGSLGWTLMARSGEVAFAERKAAAMSFSVRRMAAAIGAPMVSSSSVGMRSRMERRRSEGKAEPARDEARAAERSDGAKPRLVEDRESV